MAVRIPAWERRYSRKLVATDTAVVVTSVFGAQLIRFGFAAQELSVPLDGRQDFALTYSAVSLLLVLGWLLTLSIGDTRSRRIIGSGATEYKRVVNGTLFVFGSFAIGSYLLKVDLGRGYLMIALPAGLILLVLTRWLWRSRLHRQRQRKSHVYRSLLVGEQSKIRHVAREMSKNRNAGFDIFGAITNHDGFAELLPGLPILGDYSYILEAVDNHGAEAVILTSSDAIDAERMRHLGWELDVRRVDLVVAAALTDVAGPRIHTRPVSGLPLIQVDFPEFEGRNQFAKRLFDVVGSTVLVIVLLPVMLVVSIAVKASSPGPVFYNQIRIGLNGREFPMFKFRSMQQNADDQLQSLLDQQGTSVTPLHKVENDPRITRVGRIIRRYSLDELPQLLNVLIGTMSLVGPRPQRDAEVALYQRYDHRRLMVKPGITGLWQVSGRSDLDWDDAIRLDLYYVENWSMMGDVVLLWKTIRAVAASEGAY